MSYTPRNAVTEIMLHICFLENSTLELKTKMKSSVRIKAQRKTWYTGMGNKKDNRKEWWSQEIHAAITESK
jgi:hypothetical protein